VSNIYVSSFQFLVKLSSESNTSIFVQKQNPTPAFSHYIKFIIKVVIITTNFSLDLLNFEKYIRSYMFDIFKPLLKITSCRIKENTKKKLHFTQTALDVSQKIENSNKSIKYSEDQVINIGLDKLLKSMGLEMKEDIDITTIQVMESILKRERIDNNFKPSNKRIMRSLGNAMFDEGVVSKHLGYDEILTELISSYLERFPNFKKHILQEQHINQQFKTKKLQKKRDKEMYGID
jgi:hypothetical protein